MFHFPTFPPPALCVQAGVTGLASSRVSPFGNPRITVWLSTPRGLSQIPTSFFGSWCQGIHRAPLKTWPQRCSRPLCSSQNTGGTPPHATATPHPTDMSGTTTGRARTEEQSLRPSLQDPTACQTPPTRCATFLSPSPKGRTSTHNRHQDARCQLIDVPPLSNPHGTVGHERATWTTSPTPSHKGPKTNGRQCSLERR